MLRNSLCMDGANVVGPAREFVGGAETSVTLGTDCTGTTVYVRPSPIYPAYGDPWQYNTLRPEKSVRNERTASLAYVLPAPLGYYLDGVFKCTVLWCMGDGPGSVAPCPDSQMCDYKSFEGASMSRPVGQGKDFPEEDHAQVEFPLVCPAGVIGNSAEPRHQSGPSCTAPCSAGHCTTSGIEPETSTPCPLPAAPFL